MLRTPADFGFPDIGLSRADAQRWAEHIDPAPDAVAALPWLPDVTSGMLAADRQDRPLLAWIGIQHPLACNCPGDLYGERSNLVHPSLRPFLAEFVLAADSRAAVESGTAPGVDLFFAACSTHAGRFAGQVASGFYALSPRGELLSRCGTFHREELTAAITIALERWYQLEPAARGIPHQSALYAERARALPADTLALTCCARPLPMSDDARAGRYPSLDRTEVWWRTQDLLRVLPEVPQPGTATPLPELALDLALNRFVDPLDPRPFSIDDVVLATLVGTITAVSDDQVQVELRGETFAITPAGDHGMHTRILGDLTLERATRNVRSLRLLAKGNMRTGGGPPRPVGFTLGDSAPWRAGLVLPRTGFPPR